jgi:hypothetical protein
MVAGTPPTATVCPVLAILPALNEGQVTDNIQLPAEGV